MFPAAIPEQSGFRFLALAVVILLVVSSVALAVAGRCTLGLPAWGVVPLGWLAGMGSIWSIEYLGFYATCLLLVAAGLVFARPHGARAALFVLVAGMFATAWTVEPGMYFWDSPTWRTFISVGMTVLFTLVAPVLALRARRVGWQVAGPVIPAAGYFAAFAYGKSSVRGISISPSDSAGEPFFVILITVTMAAIGYEWIARRAWRPTARNGAGGPGV